VLYEDYDGVCGETVTSFVSICSSIEKRAKKATFPEKCEIKLGQIIFASLTAPRVCGSVCCTTCTFI
jgi:hypothetical protein